MIGKRKAFLVTLVGLVVAMMLLCGNAATATTSLVVGGYNPTTLCNDTIISAELVKGFQTGIGSATEVRLGIAGSVNSAKENKNIQQYSVSLGKLFAVGNQDSTIKFKLGGGVGYYHVRGSNANVNDVGFYGVAKLGISSKAFVEAKYTEVRRAVVGSGWSVGLGIEF